MTFDDAVLELHADAVDALRWYQSLSDKQHYIDSIGIYRAQYIYQFTVDAMWFVGEYGANGFDIPTLIDLWQRIRRKVHDHDESI